MNLRSTIQKNIEDALETLAGKGYNPSQPRDKDGKWTSAGSGSSGQTESAKDSGHLSSEADARIRGLELGIVGKEMEHAYVFDAKGNSIISQAGDAVGVPFTEQQLAQFKGATLTHNHPDNRSFSPMDIDTLHASGLRQIRVANPDYTYHAESIGKNPGGGEINMRYRNKTSSLMDKYYDAIYDGSMTKEQARAEWSHEVWQAIAPAVNIKYWRTKT